MAAPARLLRFVEDELSRAPALIERALAGTLQLLRDHHRDGGLTGSEREHHFEVVEALQRQAGRYQERFIEALREGVTLELTAQQAGAGPAGIAGLELMDESRVEVDIEISRAMQLIDGTAEWELRELQTFTSTLCGLEHVSAESNPLRPLVYATALWEAAAAVVKPQVQRAMLLRISSGVTAGLLKSAWAAASSRLEAQGVTPSVYRTVILAPGATVAREVPFVISRPGVLGSLLSRISAGGAGSVAGGRSSAGEGMPLGSGWGSNEARVVELLSRLFALIQADTDLPSPVRAVIARLQVAALGVALQDPTMLDSQDHPVWQLMNRIAHAGTAYPVAGDKRQVALLAFCEALAEEISRGPAGDAAPFRRAVARLDAFLAEQLQWQLREAQTSAVALLRAERREVLEQVLSQRLAEQMTSVPTSAPLRRFVTGSWAKVLAESMVRFGEQAEPTPSYVKAVDDLLWSLQTPDHPQSRQRLLGLLPGLLQRLREGMALIALPAAEQQAVLDELMTVHTAALRPGGRSAAASLSAEEIVQRMRDEVIPDTPAVRPFSDSVIDLASMDTVPADFLPTDAMGGTADESARRIDALAVGQRQRLFLKGRWTRTQLLWRSDQGLYFLFAGERAGATHSVTRRALERLDAAGLARPLETQALVPRTVDALLNQLALPR
jgi:hypothetical protein